MNSFVFLLSVLFCFTLSRAAVTLTGVFNGQYTESFEELTPGFAGTTTSIFGGHGTIVDTSGYIYDPSTNGFGLAGCSATVHDGSHGYGHDTDTSVSTTFNFPVGFTSFGGYFGYATTSSPATFTFYSAGGVNQGTISFTYNAVPQGCVLAYFGVISTVPITQVVFVSYYGVYDALSASFGAVSVCGNGIVESGESCDGGSCCSSTCSFLPSSQVCRIANGNCDVAETCTGASSSCPSDSFASSATVCRAAVDVCDVAETCSGSSPACPSDSLEPSTFVCRPANGSCDTTETCTGSSTACPADVLSDSTACFCARQTADGYYCDGNGGYYRCLSGPWASQSSDMTCGAGTTCGCAFGVECSCGGYRSPCVSPSSSHVGSGANQIC